MKERTETGLEAASVFDSGCRNANDLLANNLKVMKMNNWQLDNMFIANFILSLTLSIGTCSESVPNPVQTDSPLLSNGEYCRLIQFICVHTRFFQMYQIIGNMGIFSDTQFRRCHLSEGFTDPHIGKMELNPELYCDTRTFRFVPGYTCCSPEPPNVLKPVFILHRKSKAPVILDWTDPKEARKIGYGKVIILVHGWSETLDTSVWIKHAAEAFVSRGFPTVVVDWREGNKYYFQTCANVRTIGAVIGYSILVWKVWMSCDWGTKSKLRLIKVSRLLR